MSSKLVSKEMMDYYTKQFVNKFTTYGQFDELKAEVANIGYAYISKLEATELIAEKIEAEHVEVTALIAKKADITDLTAATADIKKLIAKKADIDLLNVTTADMDSAVAKTLTVEDSATIANLDAGYARLNLANVDTEWVNELLVQGNVIAQEGTVYYLDSIQVNAENITTGTLTADRIMMKDDDGNYHLIVWDETEGTYKVTTNVVDGDMIKDQTLTADKLIAHSITAEQLTINNIEGTGGWINLINGTFAYGNAETAGYISFDENNRLTIRGDLEIWSAGTNKTLIEIIEDQSNNLFINLLSQEENPTPEEYIAYTITNDEEYAPSDIDEDTAYAYYHKVYKDGVVTLKNGTGTIVTGDIYNTDGGIKQINTNEHKGLIQFGLSDEDNLQCFSSGGYYQVDFDVSCLTDTLYDGTDDIYIDCTINAKVINEASETDIVSESYHICKVSTQEVTSYHCKNVFQIPNGAASVWMTIQTSLTGDYCQAGDFIEITNCELYDISESVSNSNNLEELRNLYDKLYSDMYDEGGVVPTISKNIGDWNQHVTINDDGMWIYGSVSSVRTHYTNEGLAIVDGTDTVALFTKEGTAVNTLIVGDITDDSSDWLIYSPIENHLSFIKQGKVTE